MPTASTRFRLISGNRLDRLAEALGARLATPADPASLAPDVVLIPQPTLRHWLLQTLATRYGIAANLDLCTPSEFTWRLLRAAHPALPEHSPWERERLRWRLYALLDGDPSTLPAPVRRHLRRAAGEGADAATRALARDDLAAALAAAFDRYQAYRRDWLDAWQREAPGTRDDWQAQLWRALVRGAPDVPHRAALLGDWLARFDRDAPTFAGAAPPGLPPRLSAFGTLHVSPDVLHLLAVAGQWIDVDFHLPTPSAEYWGDVESLRARLRRDGVGALPAALAEADRDNPLLMAWGAGGRDILAQLFSYDILLPEREIELFVPPGRDSVLHRLQQDVFDRAPPTPSALDPDDVSLQVHACHSKLREVEVLHDRLRALLDEVPPDGAPPGGRRFDPPLQPHEIAVLAPDIAEYLPLARAVFGGLSPDDPRFIPYSLADRPQAQSHALATLLPDLVALADAPLTAGAFRDLLATPSIAHALSLDAQQRQRLDDWIDAVGIRWGEDAAARERAGVGRWREYSFEFGFDRLLAGYATGAAADIADIAPYPELEGADADTLDRALRAYAELRALAAWMRAPHPADAWRRRLAQTLETLLAPAPLDDAEAQARRLLLETLDDFARDAADAGALPAALVRRALRDALAAPSAHRPWLSGGVTFAGMVPLRTVPFRVLCLLGLDADAYPRREPADDVNRLVDAIQGRAPRHLGDRSVRDDDRFLFLQLVCAAGEVLHLSYGGRDARDGSLREPSPVIAELLEAVERMHGEAGREALCIEHPLQPFSPRAFGAGDPRRFSYRGEWRLPADIGGLAPEPAFVGTRLAATDSDDDDLPDRDALQRFFENPARHWLRERLGLRLPGEDDGDVDREPQGENALLRYAAVRALIDDADAAFDDDPGRSAARLRARGALPPGRDGVALAHDAHDAAARLHAARAQARGDAPATVVESDGALSSGIVFRFDDVHDGVRVVLEAGKPDGKRRLRARIDHLLLAAVLGADARTVLIGLDAGKGTTLEVVYTGFEREAARAALDALLALWREGRDAPLPFAPKSAYAYAAAWHAERDVGRAWKAAWAAYAPFQFDGEREDRWLRIAFRPDGLLGDFDGAAARRFREIAPRVFDAREPGP